MNVGKKWAKLKQICTIHKHKNCLSISFVFVELEFAKAVVKLHCAQDKSKGISSQFI